MRTRATFRNAVGVSVGVHALLAAGFVMLIRERTVEFTGTRTAVIDSRVNISFEYPAEEKSPAPEAVVKVEPDPPPKVEVIPQPQEEPTGPSRAAAITVPQSLPSELLAILKRPVASSPPAAVAQVGATTPAWMANGSPVHGALDPKQIIVYVLDASGSMGEWGKFDTARAALIATLKLQPATVRFEVVIYSGAAASLLRSPNPATAENIALTIESLQALPAPAGRSQHVEGLRTALSHRPDLVVLFTDADDLPGTALRGVLRQAAKPAKLCVAKVSAKRVEPPIELK